LTAELRSRLPHAPDINGGCRPEFAQLFDRIAEHAPDVKCNYEKFFEWLILLVHIQKNPFSNAIGVRIEPALANAAGPLAFVIKRPIWEILRSRHQCPKYQPGYFANLKNFLPESGRLEVFTLNYDLCVEDACRAEGLRVITGFHPQNRTWNPSLFEAGGVGINLYKLHGSLNWRPNDGNRWLVEDYPPQWSKEPELLLGPGLKLEPDDPFARLHCEFRNALRVAKTCVIVGFSFHDEAITKVLREADDRAVMVIDVNPSGSMTGFDHYQWLSRTAKDALESDDLLRAVNGSQGR